MLDRTSAALWCEIVRGKDTKWEQGGAYLVIVFHHHQRQFALFKIHFGNFGPGQRESIVKAWPAVKPCTHPTAVPLLRFKALTG